MDAALKEMSFSEDSISKLVKAGFTSKTLLAKLKASHVGKLKLENIAQEALLEDYIESRNRTSAAGTLHVHEAIADTATTTGPATSMQHARAQFDMLSLAAQKMKQEFPAATSLQQQQPSASSLTAPLTSLTGDAGVKLDNNLFRFLPSQKVKYKKIVDYLEDKSEEEEQELPSSAGAVDQATLLIRRGKKPKLENVTPLQYIAASLKICVDLMRENELDARGMLDYMSYVVSVCELGETFTFRSLLDYDDAYRRLQAQTSFKWGAESSQAKDKCLVRRMEKPAATKPGQQGASGRVQPRYSSPTHTPCYEFNARGSCTRGASCRFTHSCSAPGCGESHPVTQHAALPPPAVHGHAPAAPPMAPR